MEGGAGNAQPPLPPFLSGASPPAADPGGPLPPLFLDRKKFFADRPTPTPPPPHTPSQGLIWHYPPKKTPGSTPVITQNVSMVLTNKQVLIEFSIFSHGTPEIRLLSVKGYPPK